MAQAVLATADDGVGVVTINRPDARNAVNGGAFAGKRAPAWRGE